MTMTRDQMVQGAITPTADGPPKKVWTQPGDEVFGRVLLVKTDLSIPGNSDLGSLIEVDQGQPAGTCTVWTTAAQLKAGLVEGRNQLGRPVAAGDIVYIRFDGKTAIEGGKTLNTFAINVQAGAGAPQAVAAPAQVPAPVPQPAPAAVPQVTDQAAAQAAILAEQAAAHPVQNVNPDADMPF